MARWSTTEQLKWVARQLRVARETGDVDTEFAAQARLDELLDQRLTERQSDQGG